MERKKNYVAYCKAHAIDALEEMKGWGNSSYGCDLSYTLTQEINVNGSATFSTHQAKEYIKFWWDEAAEVYDYQKWNYGDPICNPFDEPERFHVCMIIEGVSALCANCPTIEEFWNDKIELDNKTINRIIREIRAQKEINF